jgi:hypothetical protein
LPADEDELDDDVMLLGDTPKYGTTPTQGEALLQNKQGMAGAGTLWLAAQQAQAAGVSGQPETCSR